MRANAGRTMPAPRLVFGFFKLSPSPGVAAASPFVFVFFLERVFADVVGTTYAVKYRVKLMNKAWTNWSDALTLTVE